MRDRQIPPAAVTRVRPAPDKALLDTDPVAGLIRMTRPHHTRGTPSTVMSPDRETGPSTQASRDRPHAPAGPKTITDRQENTMT